MSAAPDPREVGEDYDEGADGYDARHAADPRSARRSAVMDRLQVAAIGGAQEVLEVGCGTGRLLAQVAAPRRIGIDVSRGMLRHAAARGLAVARADAHALPFGDGKFDAVLAGKGVFRYLEPARAFGECARVLRPGGRLVVHLYAGRTWSPRRMAAPRRTGTAAGAAEGSGLFEPGDVDEIVAPARAAGLEPVAIHRLRSIRIRPYLLEIPAWIDRAVPAQLWSHVIVALQRVAR